MFPLSLYIIDGFYHVTREASEGDSVEFGNSLDKNLFDDYFSASRASLLNPAGGADSDSVNKNSIVKTDATNEHFAGLPSLSPNVVVTKNNDDIVLNGQTPELAQLLELGDCWWLTNDFSVPDSNWDKSEKPANSWGEWGDNLAGQRNTSDPNLPTHLERKPIERSSSYDESSSKQHSMIGNLKKLFSYQLPGATMTPPDQRMCEYLSVLSICVSFCSSLLMA